MHIELNKISGFEASIYGISCLIRVVENCDNIFPFKFSQYGLSWHDETVIDEYVSLEHFRRTSEEAVKYFSKKDANFKLLTGAEKKTDEGIAKLDSFVKVQIPKLKELSDEQLIIKYFEFVDTYCLYYAYGAVIFTYEEIVPEILCKSLKCQNPAEFILAYLEKSKYKSFIAEYENRIKNLKNVKDILSEFYFLKTNYFDSRTLTKKDVYKDAKNLKGKPKVTRKKIRIRLSKKEKVMLDLLLKTIPIRDKRKKLSMIGTYVVFRFLNEAVRRKRVKERELLKRMFWHEFGDFVHEPQLVIQKLKKRTEACMFIKDKTAYYLGKNCIVDISKYEKELRGMPSSPGVVQGMVKIIPGPRDFYKFQKGEILVTTSTRPDFVPIMKLASAIITEEGGLTSHAAIISREFGIPCIIGTKVATKTLKDGDLIEVDANKGIVRKL